MKSIARKASTLSSDRRHRRFAGLTGALHGTEHHQSRDQAPVQPGRTRRHREVRDPLPPRHEHHLAARRDRAQPGRRHRQADHARHLRLQLPRRDLRLLRHAHQRQSPHGLLRAGRQAHRPNKDQPITLAPLSPSSPSSATSPSTAASSSRTSRRSRPGSPSTAPTTSAKAHASSPSFRRHSIRSRTASPAASAWRSAPSSTLPPAL